MLAPAELVYFYYYYFDYYYYRYSYLPVELVVGEVEP